MFLILNYFLSQISAVMAVLISAVVPLHTTPTDCGENNNVKYCYYAGDESSNEVVYFLHGYTNSVEAWGWNPVTKQVIAEWDKNKILKPHVVSLGLSPVWFFTIKDHKDLLDSFIVNYESQVLKRKVIQRTLYGDSMGGHNALKWAQASPEIFNRVALICPALPKSYVSPKLTSGSGIWPFPPISNYFISKNSALEDGTPINPLKPDSIQKLPNFYLAAVPKDHYGFYEGAVELKRLLEEAGKTVVYEEQDAIHCLIKAKKLAQFLAGN